MIGKPWPRRKHDYFRWNQVERITLVLFRHSCILTRLCCRWILNRRKKTRSRWCLCPATRASRGGSSPASVALDQTQVNIFFYSAIFRIKSLGRVCLIDGDKGRHCTVGSAGCHALGKLRPLVGSAWHESNKQTGGLLPEEAPC